MKRRIIRTFTAILLMIVAIAGFMPCASKQVKAEPATKQIIFDEDTVKSINTDLTYSFSKEGITLSPDCDGSYQFEEGGGASVNFVGKELIVRHGSFTFSSSIGKILKIEIETYNADILPDGWNWNREDRIASWEGEPSYAVTIINEAERMDDETYIGPITKMTFTIITEDVTDIALSDSSLEMKPKDAKSLTATVSPETATEKE
ncbi:MAG: hypothetical protein K5908_03305, partial [Erysipelotrichaceae bacterium]|nr:hypothetical protein [Erysipelotrichaceae bacterium]